MIEAVFISDLHLHPEELQSTKKFEQWIEWAKKNAKRAYILGDFFHVWPGDEALDNWSKSIAQQLAQLVQSGTDVYFIPGNRDFLLSKQFAQLARIKILADPSLIQLGQYQVLLTHGDQYCIRDKSHQRLRRFTRNKFFIRMFLCLPYKLRARLVMAVRNHSQNHRYKPKNQLSTDKQTILRQMKALKAQVLIHGHTHTPGLEIWNEAREGSYRCYVLSDWDDVIRVLCYDKSNGFYFVLL